MVFFWAHFFCFIPNRSKNQMFPGTASRTIPIFKLNVSGVMQNGKLQWVLAWGFVLAMSWGNGELWGQTTIAKQGFETSGETWSISSGSGNISTVTGSGDTPSSQRVLSGGRSWQVNNGNITLELGNVNVSSYSTIKIVIRLSSTSGSTGNGADGGDNIKAFVNLNGSGFPATADVTISGNSNARWGYNATLTATTTAGTPLAISAPQSGTNTNNYSAIEISIPNGTSSVALKIVALNNDGNEIWNIDDIELTGSSTCTPPTTQASGFASANILYNQMDISFTRGNGTGGVLVLAKAGSAVDADPSASTTYTANAAFGSGDQIGTGNYVVYNGAANGAGNASGNVAISGLSASTT